MTDTDVKVKENQELKDPTIADAGSNPFAAAPSSKKMLTLIGIYACLVATIIQSATASTLLPIAAADIGGLDIYSMANNVSGVVGVVSMPLWGYIAAKSPNLKRSLFFWSMIAGVVCLFGRAMAPDMITLIAVSVFWGFPSAGIYVVGYSMIRDMYDAKQAGTYLGICVTFQSVAMLVGPVAGGFIMDAWSWRALCVIMGVLLTLGALLVFFGVKVTKEQAASMATSSGSFDISGALAVAIFLGCLICGLSLGTTLLPFGGIGSNIVIIVAVAALIWLIVVIRSKKDAAFIPLSALKDRNTIAFTLANFFSNFAQMAVFFFLPMYVLTVIGLSAAEAGLTTTMMSIAGLFMGPIYGRMIGKQMSAKTVLSISAIIRFVVVIALMAICAPDANIFIIYAIMFVAGFYNSASATSFSSGPQIQLNENLRVQGNSIIQVGQNFGGAVGTVAFSLVLASMGIVDGMPVALILAAIAAVIVLICSVMLKKVSKD